MTTEPLRVAIVSAVRHARNYAAIIASSDDFEVVAVVEEASAPPIAQRDARALASDLGVQLTDRLPEDIDVALVCSEPTRHARLAIAALEAGVHTVIDKPVATTLDDARAVRDAAGDRVCTVVNRTLLSATARARATIDAGTIGFVRSIDVEFFSDGAQFSVAVERPELVVDRRLSGGGELMNFAGYCIDTVRILTGCEPVEVYAVAGALFSDIHRAHDVEDVAALSLVFTNGVVASVGVGRIPAAPAAGPGASSTRIIGSHGHLLIDDSKPAIVLDRADGNREELFAGGEQEAVSELLADVAAAIRFGAPLRYSVDDAVASIAAIEAAYRSVETAQPEPVHT